MSLKLFRLTQISLYLIVVAHQLFSSLGEVKAPISTDTPIKLVNKKESHDVKNAPASASQQNSIRSSREEQGQEQVALPRSAAVDHDTTTRTTTSSSRSSIPGNVSPARGRVHLKVHEPPHGSFIAGTYFFVGLQVLTSDSESERLVRAARDDYRVCISVDHGHYSCWSTNSTIVYAHAIHGSHSLIAKLYKDENLLDETASSLITFTTVSDPSMNVSGVEFHSQFSNLQANNQEDEHIDAEDDMVDLDQNDVESDDEDDESFQEEEEGVHVSFPAVEFHTPSDQVSYTGSDLMIDTVLKPQDPEQFSKYFKQSFTCFSIDMATAQPCFQLFQDHTNPLMVGLDIGFHTIEASLTNPETMELLEASRSGLQTFFMAGQENKGAVFTAEINLRGKLHQVPIVKGGNLVAQTKSLCRSVGLAEQAICLEPVFRHLQMVGRQVGFLQQDTGGY